MLPRFFCCALFALLPAFSAAATVQFSARQDTATGFRIMYGLAVADFNGDGKPDIAVTDGFGKRVLVYLNNGTGGLGAPITTVLTISNTTGPVVAGDVNEDGKQDLIVSTVAGDQRNIALLGNGDGTFTQGNAMPGSFGFQSGALKDLNNDKHLDFIAGGNGPVDVYLGDGKGNFTHQSVPILGQGDVFFSVVAADFNRDNQIDYIVSTFDLNGVRFFAGVGDGSFRAPVDFVPSNTPLIASIDVADFDGDGKLDLLLGGAYAASLVYGNGDGSFRIDKTQVKNLPVTKGRSTAATNPDLVATADMDGNGTPDVVLVDYGTNLISVLLNNDKGLFLQKKPDFSAASLPDSNLIELADMNGDGLPDIIITNQQTQAISIFLSIATKQTPTVMVTASAPQILVGSPVTLSIKVAGSGSVTPTGTVSLSDGTTPLGQQTLDSTGNATFTLSTLSAGQHTLTLAYSGDQRYAASTAAPVSEAVVDLQIALPTASQTVSAGATATYAVTLTPIGGLAGTVSLTCSGLPAGYACTSVPTVLTGQNVTASLVVGPLKTATSVSTHSPISSLLPITLAGCSFGVVLLLPSGWRSRKLIAFLFAMTAMSLTGCGGGPQSAPRYTGTSTFTITATCALGAQTLSRQTTATLTVQ